MIYITDNWYFIICKQAALGNIILECQLCTAMWNTACLGRKNTSHTAYVTKHTTLASDAVFTFQTYTVNVP